MMGIPSEGAPKRMVKLDQYLEIRELARQGFSKAEVGRRWGLERKTVRKYLKPSSGPPV